MLYLMDVVFGLKWVLGVTAALSVLMLFGLMFFADDLEYEHGVRRLHITADRALALFLICIIILVLLPSEATMRAWAGL